MVFLLVLIAMQIAPCCHFALFRLPVACPQCKKQVCVGKRKVLAVQLRTQVGFARMGAAKKNCTNQLGKALLISQTQTMKIPSPMAGNPQHQSISMSSGMVCTMVPLQIPHGNLWNVIQQMRNLWNPCQKKSWERSVQGHDKHNAICILHWHGTANVYPFCDAIVLKTDVAADQVHCHQVDDFSIKAPILPPDVGCFVWEKRTETVGGTCHSQRAMHRDLMRMGKDRHKFCKNC